jgi:hypothetical protein
MCGNASGRKMAAQLRHSELVWPNGSLFSQNGSRREGQRGREEREELSYLTESACVVRLFERDGEGQTSACGDGEGEEEGEERFVGC